MNKRIEELARKARALATTKDAFEEYDVYFDAEKFEQVFAELLIKDCIAVAAKADNEDQVCAWYAIQQHFEIKE